MKQMVRGFNAGINFNGSIKIVAVGINVYLYEVERVFLVWKEWIINSQWDYEFWKVLQWISIFLIAIMNNFAWILKTEQ